MGGIILVASILIWALGYYPQNTVYSINYDKQISAITADTLLTNEVKTDSIRVLSSMKVNEKQEQSYIGQMGKAIEPIIQPLGFDWKIGVCIITGLAAKEIVVSTMGVLYHADMEADETSSALIKNLRNQKHMHGELKGQKVFSPLVAFGFMLFILIYFPCIAVIAAIKKEASLGWAVFTMVYTTVIAWLVAFGVYQIGSLL